MPLIVVSNRLPFILEKDEQGEYQVRPSSGGLVSSLAPVLKGKGGLWIGWSGIADVPEKALKRAISHASAAEGIDFEPVQLSSREIDYYYAGFSNEILWPLFHDMAGRCNFDPEYWAAYQAVNQKFAAKIRTNLKADDYIWIHDYQLLCVGHALREMGVKERIGFFLHLPFPSPDIFMQLPWGLDILKAMLSYNLVGLSQADRKKVHTEVLFSKNCRYIDRFGIITGYPTDLFSDGKSLLIRILFRSVQSALEKV